MEIKYRQSKGQLGCGSFALANIFDDERYIAEIPATQGETIGMLNKKIQQFEPALYIEPAYLTDANFKICNRFMQRELFDLDWSSYGGDIKTVCRCMLMTIAQDNGQLHMVALIQNFADSTFYVVDSDQPAISVLTIEILLLRYHIVGIDIFCCWDSPDLKGAVIAFKKDMPHIFGTGE